ncbi:MAG TPA: tRNA (adenosine(37)-N6)-threonylcarbamoyltransferase complex dimerization subunit type 1 TsaB [Erythrobacter sp.]|nr:tRNA (adenosine(37)-N6)-threonylcarbamoyltransferase complex dimerization subunit type 1 TsaB [Erythrobacter sp.]
MRTLAIETATEACSVALFDGPELVARDHRVLGRGHAEQLVPMIAALPGKGEAGRILVSRGPGSFTGVRIGIATARALGFAWKAEVLGYPTLALVAAMARADLPDQPVTVCMNGGHGEWFVQDFDDAGPLGEVLSLAPGEAAASCRSKLVAGNRAMELAELLGGGAPALNILPDASAVRLLPEGTLGSDLTPIYGRGPDAKLPGEAKAQ